MKQPPDAARVPVTAFTQLLPGRCDSAGCRLAAIRAGLGSAGPAVPALSLSGPLFSDSQDGSPQGDRPRSAQVSEEESPQGPACGGFRGTLGGRGLRAQRPLLRLLASGSLSLPGRDRSHTAVLPPSLRAGDPVAWGRL